MYSEGPRRTPGRTASGKILCEKAFAIAIHPKYNGYQKSLVSMVYNFATKRLPAVLLKVKLF